MVESFSIPDFSPHSAAERAALAIVRRLRAAGHEAYWVGGAVRNRLLDLPAEDVDIATSAAPADVAALFGESRFVGAKFGVCLVSIAEGEGKESGEGGAPPVCEVATFRREGPYSDHRRPDSVEPGTPAEDALRRDFTVNALLLDPLDGRVIDYVGGLADLRGRRIRCVGAPDDRFAEDALRVLRAVRFAARLAFEIEPGTWDALRRHAPDLQLISAERLREELVRMMCGPHPGRALDLLFDAGILAVILPEVAAMRDCPHTPDFHPEGGVWEHTKLCLERMPAAPSPTLAMAVLLHDIGKPATIERLAGGKLRFPGHAGVGARMAEEICRRLRFSNAEIEAIVAIVGRHMHFVQIREMRPGRRARFLAAPTIADDLEMHRIDCEASHGDLSVYHWVQGELEAARSAGRAVLPPPMLNGEDLIAMGYRPGPLFSEILAALPEAQIEGKIATADEARHWVRATWPPQS